MRRLAVIFLLLWLPLHWSWAATVAFCGHPATAAERAAHAMVIEPAVDADAADAAAMAIEQDEDCPLCQAADWQAALPTMPRFGPAGEMPPPFEDSPPFESFVPPVPKPPARLPAA
jgi:hypothetical protein